MKKTRHPHFALKLSLFIFLTITVTMVLVGCIFMLLLEWGVLKFDRLSPFYVLFIILIMSVIIGTVLSYIFGKKSAKKIDKFIMAMHKVSEGDFTARLTTTHEQGLDRVAVQFNLMAKELSSIETLRSDFVSNFSHEFKTPIVSIRGFAKLLKSADLTEDERQEYLDIIADEAGRLAVLSDNTLLLSRLQSKEIIEKNSYLLDEQIRQCVLVLQYQWEKKNLKFDISLPKMLFMGNENLMQQLWINLLGNAIKFSNPNGNIAVGATVAEGKTVVTISDEGCGMDEDTVDKIYDRFYQGDPSRNTQGNGLGLTIAKKIVELSNGTLNVRSAKEKGSTFIIVLPNE